MNDAPPLARVDGLGGVFIAVAVRYRDAVEAMLGVSRDNERRFIALEDAS